VADDPAQTDEGAGSAGWIGGDEQSEGEWHIRHADLTAPHFMASVSGSEEQKRKLSLRGTLYLLQQGLHDAALMEQMGCAL
jgi:hypothetical protein